MNRRVTVKKNYFSLLPDLSGSRIIRTGLFLAAGIAVTLLGWLAFSRFEMDVSTVFGVFALVAIPLIVLAVVFVGLEKITGISCLRGVEWVGKNTLLLFDWVVIKIQKWRGIEVKASKHRDPQSSATLSRSSSAIGTTAAVETQKPYTEEPVLDFDSIGTKDSLFDPLEYKQDLFSEAPGSEFVEPAVNISVETPIIEEHNKAYSTPSIAVSDPVDDQGFFEPDEADSIDKLQDSITRDELTNASVGVELPTKEELDKTHSMPSIANINDPIDEQTVFNLDGFEQIDGSYDIAKEDVLTTVAPELDIDAVELEIKSLFQDEQSWQEDEIGPGPENKSQIEESDFSLTIDNEPKESELNYSIKSLFDEVENEISDSEKGGDSAINSNKVSGMIEDEINLSNNSTDSTDRVLTDTENDLSHPSMLVQAEQTAANILSSFSEKFSRSSDKLSQSFSFHKEPEYHLPSIDLLQTHQRSVRSYSTAKLEEMSRTVERVLKDYKVLAEVVGAYPGPIITRFELTLAPGVKVSRVSGLAKDLARAMLVTSVRVVEIIEGTPYIGLEIPNQERELVSFREIIASEKYQQAVSPLTFALGKDVSGQTVVSDLAKMPHLLVAGTTGSGKSVAINTMILSMLYKATPDQVRMIMVDPKMLELSIYEGIPHLLTPVVTDMKEAQNALRWAVAEMERRYKLMSKVGVRNLAGFNQKIEDAAARGETIRDPLFQLIDPLEEGETFPVLSALPSIVIVIDELADMMMIVGKKVEELIARLAQKARAAGIHLVLATQRPSVDVLTGLIKANVPTRISFQVSSRIDSRTILDQGGAEALLGNGDMLFLPSGTSVPTRSHGAFVDDDEVHAVVDYLKTQGGTNYLTEITQEAPVENTTNTEVVQDEVDDLYDDAVNFVKETGRASISSVQRRFKVGYNRAARMIDQMEEENIVSEPEGNGSRRVLNREE